MGKGILGLAMESIKKGSIASIKKHGYEFGKKVTDNSIKHGAGFMIGVGIGQIINAITRQNEAVKKKPENIPMPYEKPNAREDIIKLLVIAIGIFVLMCVLASIFIK